MRRTTNVLAVLLTLLGAGSTSCRETPTVSTPVIAAAQPTSGSTAAPKSPTESTQKAPRTCTSGSTRIAVAATASTMSQPFADIAITNTGSGSCLLRGYPRIQAGGHHGWKHTTRPVRLGTISHHGIYERVDHGPRPVIVQPHDAAFFSVGTASAYQGGLHPMTITRLLVTLPGVRSPKALSIKLLATRPVGAMIPVGVTAVRPAQRSLSAPTH